MNPRQFIYSQSQKNSISSIASTVEAILCVNSSFVDTATSPTRNPNASSSQFSSPSAYSYRYSTLKEAALSSMNADVTNLSDLVARMEEHQDEASNTTPATPINLRFIR
jgi:hypothetical protein